MSILRGFGCPDKVFGVFSPMDRKGICEAGRGEVSTVHPTIGSGTKLALEDGIALAHALTTHQDLEQALICYEHERKPTVEVFQEAAAYSKAYFENLDRYVHLQPMQLTVHLLTRSLRVDYDNLRIRDALFVDRFNRWFADEATKTEWNKERISVSAP